MAEFDFPGITKARAALVQLAKEDHRGHGNTEINRQIINELYPELRDDRTKGTSWKKLRNALCANLNIKISSQTLMKMFNKIDEHYADETGVAPLHKVGRPRKVQ